MRKVRTDLNLTEKQLRALRQIANEMDISVSDLLRRIIDKWLEEREERLSYKGKKI